MNAVVIPAGQKLIDEVLNHIEGNKRDYSPSLVIFPGRRPAHFLRKALALRIGSSFIPPELLSMDEFIDSICDEFSPHRQLETIDAVAILYDIHRKCLVPLGGKGFMTPDSFFSLGLKIYRDIEELHIEGINHLMVRGVQTLITEGLPEGTRERLQSLSYFYERFYSELAALGLYSRSMRYQIAAAHIGESRINKYEKTIFAGFFALTQAEKILFRKLFPSEKVVFVFQDGAGLKEKLKDLGISYKGRGEEAGRPDVHFYSSPDTHGQILALGKILETHVEAGDPLDDGSVIVLPASETLFPLLRQGLSELPEDGYNVSLGYPLQRTPIFGFLNNLMDMLNSMDGERVYIPDYLKFVLHPYTKNIYYKGNSETTRILFHAVEEELLKQKAKIFVTLAEIEGKESLFRDVIRKHPGNGDVVTEEGLRAHLKAIHRNTIGRFSSFENVADFARKCMDLLIYILNESTARLHPLFYPFAESFVASLDLLMVSLMKDTAFTDRSSYFIFLRRYVMTCRTPFAGTPLKGLQVLGFLETRNLKFDKVFVLDANEDILPDTTKEETLLPFKARQILALPTYMDRDRLAAYYFESLLAGAKEVHLFYVSNDRAEPSRFVEKLLWERQKRDKEARAIDYIKTVQYQVRLINRVPDPISKTDGMVAFLRDYHYNATALNQYLKCPAQFYYARVLGLRAKDEITGDIGRDDLGSFVHNILRRYFINKRGRPLKEADLTFGEMDVLVESAFENEYGKDPSGAIYLLKRQMKRRMSEILKNYYIPLLRKNELTILEVEESIEARVDGFNLKGRLDSVEKRGEKTCIVDYKTGSNKDRLKIAFGKLDPDVRDTWPEAIGSLQLPFYMMLYSEKYPVRIEDLDGIFLLLGRCLINEEIELRIFDSPPEEESLKMLRSIILNLLSEIVDSRAPFVSAGGKRETCIYCDFQYICGTQWITK
ncbi:conserved hypothetical protein [Candidatus Sulfobium mesophilum]|uniref:PD-(D/E)XK endonuclease-like domain-containing protein n=1 Tax=Candidatus Sulfobium mesophilum TaxID=2016548 RepID=A0A2U3QFS3_9BACT|nr:conserved hypothetical protein [Candidatus Sulfobium mesophilum]